MDFELSMTWALPACAGTNGVGSVWDFITSHVDAAIHCRLFQDHAMLLAIAALRSSFAEASP